MIYRKNNNGFALIEFLVIIAIVLALTAITIINFPKVKLQFSLLRSAYKLGQDLRLAQEMSFAGLPYKDSSGTAQKIDGYGIFIDLEGLGSKKYIIYADKNPGNEKYDPSDYLVSTIDFSLIEPGIQIKEIKNVISNKASVNFSSSETKTAITRLSPGQNKVEFVFAIESDLAKQKSVLVNTSGLIETK